MSERFYTILSSASSRELIEESIRDFYAGSVKTLRLYCPGLWDVLNADGSVLAGVQVRTKRGRYLFVSVP